MRDAQAARQQRERELERLEVHVAFGVLEPLQAGLRGALQALDRRATLALVGLERLRDPRVGDQRRTSAIASSIASLVPEPTEKCAVCAASPTSTTLP